MSYIYILFVLSYAIGVPVLALLAGWDVVAWDVVFRQSLFVNIITDVVVTWDVVVDWGAVDVFDWGLVVGGVAAGDQLSHPGLHAYHPPCPPIPCNKSCPRFTFSIFFMLYMLYVFSLLRSPVPFRGFQLLRFSRLSRRKRVRRNFWSWWQKTAC